MFAINAVDWKMNIIPLEGVCYTTREVFKRPKLVTTLLSMALREVFTARAHLPKNAFIAILL